jgi:hypothetical protein
LISESPSLLPFPLVPVPSATSSSLSPHSHPYSSPCIHFSSILDISLTTLPPQAFVPPSLSTSHFIYGLFASSPPHDMLPRFPFPLPYASSIRSYLVICSPVHLRSHFSLPLPSFYLRLLLPSRRCPFLLRRPSTPRTSPHPSLFSFPPPHPSLLLIHIPAPVMHIGNPPSSPDTTEDNYLFAPPQEQEGETMFQYPGTPAPGSAFGSECPLPLHLFCTGDESWVASRCVRKRQANCLIRDSTHCGRRWWDRVTDVSWWFWDPGMVDGVSRRVFFFFFRLSFDDAWGSSRTGRGECTGRASLVVAGGGPLIAVTKCAHFGEPCLSRPEFRDLFSVPRVERARGADVDG